MNFSGGIESVGSCYAAFNSLEMNVRDKTKRCLCYEQIFNVAKVAVKEASFAAKGLRWNWKWLIISIA